MTRQINRSALAAIVLAATTASTTHASIHPDGADEAQYVALGATMQGKALFWQHNSASVPSNNYTASATYLNEHYVLTCGHCTESPGGEDTYKVGTGTNYNTDRGTVIDVAAVKANPAYVYGSSSTTSLDLAIARLATPLAGTPATIATGFQDHDIMTGAGYGVGGTPSTYTGVRDGTLRGWRAGARHHVPSYVNPNYFMSTADLFFGMYAGSLPFDQAPGRASPGDSGSPLFDSSGQLIGINADGTLPVDSQGTTFSVMLFEPSINLWLRQNTGLGLIAGDANASGTVNFDDLIALAQNYNRSTDAWWKDGDFNGSGSVNFDDLIILAQHYNTGVGANLGSIDGVSTDFAADWALAQSLVPEPTMLAGAAMVLLRGRRRTRRV